jgi:peptide/nickel transport system permease protein
LRTEDDLERLGEGGGSGAFGGEPSGVTMSTGELGGGELGSQLEPVPRSQWQLFRRRFFKHRLAVASGVMLVVIIVACFGAHWIAPYPKNQQHLPGAQVVNGKVVLTGGPEAPSRDHLFGTDQLGRDQFTEVLYAGQISLKIGLAVALISTVIGAIIGAIAGFLGKWTDQLLMRFTDLFLIVPAIAVLAIALKRFGQTDTMIIIVLAALGWMYIARVVRGQVLSLKEKEFVEAARAAGASNSRMISRHILPNCIGPILVNATLAVAAAIITESTLSFLGFGVQPPDTSWGVMLANAEGNYEINWWLLYFPGIMILFTVICVNFLGDGLRDAFDPHAKH